MQQMTYEIKREAEENKEIKKMWNESSEKMTKAAGCRSNA